MTQHYKIRRIMPMPSQRGMIYTALNKHEEHSMYIQEIIHSINSAFHSLSLTKDIFV